MKNIILLIFLFIMGQLVFPSHANVKTVKTVLCDDRPCLVASTTIWSTLR